MSKLKELLKNFIVVIPSEVRDLQLPATAVIPCEVGRSPFHAVIPSEVRRSRTQSRDLLCPATLVIPSNARNLLFAVIALCIVPLARAQSPDLPTGPMQAKVTTACTECHESRIILQQRLSKGAWTKEVDKMIKWGAVVDPTDRDGFIDYLSINFPPDKAPEQMPRVSAKKQ